jgi:glycosyltransferase involved in cell wall biosynthesis
VEKDRKSKYYIFFEKSKTTNGARFFSNLNDFLSDTSCKKYSDASVVLFNISATFTSILKAKLSGKKVVIRAATLYFDSFSPSSIKNFPVITRSFILLLQKIGVGNRILAFLTNFIDGNFKVLFKVFLANHIIYQSEFARKIYLPFVKHISSSVILNGSINRYSRRSDLNNKISNGELQLVTIYDEYRLSKRMYDLFNFIIWLNEEKKLSIKLVILGYSGKWNDSYPDDMVTLLNKPYFIKAPKFSEFSDSHEEYFFNSVSYITFSFRDACPNVIVESLSYGLPILGLNSGGISEIVGRAGILLSDNFNDEDYYSNHRFVHDFPVISFEKMYLGLLNLISNNNAYRASARKQFSNKLDIKVISSMYKSLLEKIK